MLILVLAWIFDFGSLCNESMVDLLMAFGWNWTEWILHLRFLKDQRVFQGICWWLKHSRPWQGLATRTGYRVPVIHIIKEWYSEMQAVSGWEMISCSSCTILGWKTIAHVPCNRSMPTALPFFQPKIHKESFVRFGWWQMDHLKLPPCSAFYVLIWYEHRRI